ncbi:MAG: hypothetical protein AVDCRST_MAG01-01-3502 [uncultured Rubrobacteraceae bacterium]|uniref:Uncharacterized protein n=1 Tax=uncultured Rubrobacteraceae bacterium TaxID=349277 RepID=A0A6J4QJP4_9ACTN|nr:MAG: hypothetical protein AVDCRST_MAG01-01-3502 [uncultured Rubrobacteraceae bacterium]
MQLALIFREFEDELYPVRPPLFVQRALFGLLAPVGELLGYRARYPRYSGPEEEPPGRGGGRPSAASGATTGGIVVATVVAVLALLMLQRRSSSSRRR